MSNLVGVLAILALFVVFAGGVWVSVQGLLASQGQAAQVIAMESELSGLAGELESVAVSSNPTGLVDVSPPGSQGRSGQTVVDPDAGRIVVDVVGQGGTELETQLGTVVYQRDGETVAVQGAGVWRGRASGPSEMVQAPPLASAGVVGSSYSLTLTVVRIRGEGPLEGVVSLTSQGQSDIYAPVYVPADSAVAVTIQSEHARAWKEYFERVFPASTSTITYPAGATDRVRVVYDPPSGFYFHSTLYEVRIAER